MNGLERAWLASPSSTGSGSMTTAGSPAPNVLASAFGAARQGQAAKQRDMDEAV